MNLSDNNYTGYNFFLKLLAVPGEVFTLHSFTYRGMNVWYLGLMWIPWLFIMIVMGAIRYGNRWVIPSNAAWFLLLVTLVGLVHVAIFYYARRPNLLATVQIKEADAEPVSWFERPFPGGSDRVRLYFDPAVTLLAGYLLWRTTGTVVGSILIISGIARCGLTYTSYYGREWRIKRAVQRQQFLQKDADTQRKRQMDEVKNEDWSLREDCQQFDIETVSELERGGAYRGTRLKGRQAAASVEHKSPNRAAPPSVVIPTPSAGNEEAAEGSFRADKLKQQRAKTTQKSDVEDS